MFIDTHCHLSIEDYDDIDKVVKEDIEAGVKGMSVPTLCRIAKVLRLSTDYILWGKSGQENPDSVMMVLAPGGISHSGPGGNRQLWPDENSQS